MFGAATIMGIILRGIGAVRLRLVARRSDVSAADLSDLKALNRCTSFMVVGAAMCFGLLAGLTIMFRIYSGRKRRFGSEGEVIGG